MFCSLFLLHLIRASISHLLYFFLLLRSTLNRSSRSRIPKSFIYSQYLLILSQQLYYNVKLMARKPLHFNFSNRKGTIVHFPISCLVCFTHHCIVCERNVNANNSFCFISGGKSMLKRCGKEHKHTYNVNCWFGVTICSMLMLSRRHTTIKTKQYKYFGFLLLSENLLVLLWDSRQTNADVRRWSLRAFELHLSDSSQVNRPSVPSYQRRRHTRILDFFYREDIKKTTEIVEDDCDCSYVREKHSWSQNRHSNDLAGHFTK